MSEEIVLGGGCFWCVEAVLEEVEGVENVVSGYAGGEAEDPSYDKVCSGSTGHAEVVKVEFSEDVISLKEVLEIFFRIHDPTTQDREGPDKGSQYRSIILYRSERQERNVREFIRRKQEEYSDEIVTEVKELEKFYPAEERHQDYYRKNPDDSYCRIHIPPKLEKIG